MPAVPRPPLRRAAGALAAGGGAGSPPADKSPRARLADLASAGREALGYVAATVRLVLRSSRPLTLAFLGLTAIAAVVPLFVAYAGKRIVDAVLLHSRPATMAWVGFELALIAAQATTQRGLALVRSVLGARLGVDVNVAILERASVMELRHFENAEFYDSLTRARREASSRPVALLGDALSALQNIVTMTGYVILLIQFSGVAVLGLILATVPATVAEMRLSKHAFRLRNWRSPESRRLLYLEHVLADDDHAKEVRLLGIGPLLLGRYKALAEGFYAEDKALSVRRALITHSLALVATGTFYLAYGAMALAAAAGALTLGTMTMYVLAFRNGQQSFQSILGSIGNIYEHNLYMSNLFSFLGTETGHHAEPGDHRNVSPKTPPPNPKTGGNPSSFHPDGVRATSTADATHEVGIRFEGVGFRYPGKELWAIRGLDLFVPSGQSIALVGSNGAGKTTLIKLMTRLYRPNEGRILLDGKDLEDWDEGALRARFGVVFQDFNQYQLSLGENVGLGSVTHLGEAPRIERAIERGGAKELASTLVNGLDAQLGRWFKDGTDLSGGQWQKVALARAFMREEADILILDEPTAALDADAEHAVFTRFRELSQGRTTVVISHRFPTVKMADRILVLDHGQVVEEGSHGDLLARGGRYARMFALQAEGYL